MELSLDEIIQQKRAVRRTRGRGRGRGGRVPMRSPVTSFKSRSRPNNVLSSNWKHDLFGSLNTQLVSVVSGGSAKMHISNLDFGVTDGDMHELFKEFGTLKKAAVHYDRSGRSLGTAEVIFGNASSAKRAKDTYNNVPLDGRPMKIDIVGERPNLTGTSLAVRPVRADQLLKRLPARTNRGGRGNFLPNMRRGALAAARARRGGGVGGRGRGAKRGGKPRQDVSKDQLDKELMDYNSQRS
ncbi:hypothetical protein Ciccas_003583 [Cichlidogyrus casuarinus]|uniref:RRM domain-containing protein n=1 Tax=Cichlidogyrus casuarinus TaxID=1844966 RepID=A0ABD2QDX8_9PLAT